MKRLFVKRACFLGICFSFLLCPSIPPGFASGYSIAAIQERGVLRVALENDDWAYFLRWNQDTPSGLCVDLAREVAEALGVPPVFLPVSWGGGEGGSIAGILGGFPWGTSFDMIASAVTVTPERSARVHFSEPYAFVGQMVLFHGGNAQILSLESFRGRRVGFPQDTTSEPAARSLPSSNTLIPLENASATFRAFEEGGVDTMVIDSPLALLFLKDHPETEVLDKLLTREVYALVLPLSSDPELQDLVDRVVLEQRELLEDHWIP